MATERTAIAPDGTVVHFDTVDQTVMLPGGAVVNAAIEAAAGGQSILPLIVNSHEMNQTGGTL